ncbi:trace amine-associated receptor 6-like [Diadema antillarum]|uniref:trace amine-associated receptor 6-like n=1 Tax=Diadema antillarum TaxID=105358 RepID=UPI003A8A5F09
MNACVSLPLELYIRTVRNEVTCSLSSAEYFYLWSYVFVYGSLTHLLLVSLDRYIAVTRPLRYESIVTNRRIGIAVTAAWALTLTYAVARISVDSDGSAKHFIYSYCLGERSSSSNISMVFDLLVLISILIVGAFLMVLNIRILLIAIRQANRIAIVEDAMRAPGAPRKRGNSSRHVKATKITLLMVSSFLVCFMPLASFLGAARYITSDRWYVTADDCAFFLVCVSSMTNPLIYFSRDTTFRENAVSILRSLQTNMRQKLTKSTSLV